MNTILTGDALTVLRTLPAASVQVCVTSPPYWGLRDYGVAGQLGAEKTPGEYIAKLVAIFGEVRRVLRDDGTCWLNLGDTFINAKGMAHGVDPKQRARCFGLRPNDVSVPGYKRKDIAGIPWRTAFALQDDGWYLRSDIVWNKPNPMPESVTDRPTRSHEFVFLLTKSLRYFYDSSAISEPVVRGYAGSTFTKGKTAAAGLGRVSQLPRQEQVVRNARSVWTINPKPYKGAHFAVFPPELPERCIKAGSSERGACVACGAPWRRIVSRAERPIVRSDVKKNERDGGIHAEHGLERTGLSHFKYNEWLRENPPKTVGWKPTCECSGEVVPCTVLDPFAGSGTTCAVAKTFGRNFIGIELNSDYMALAVKRIAEGV
jgi:DNA modification methylase